MASQLPDCGLFQFIQETKIGPMAIAKDQLVYFHNHSDEGPPVVLFPESNHHNRWSFQTKGLLLKELSPLKIMTPLKAEGLYRVKQQANPRDDLIIPQYALVQLGYTTKSESILFFPTPSPNNNSFEFSDRGIKIPKEIETLLEPLDTQGLLQPKSP